MQLQFSINYEIINHDLQTIFKKLYCTSLLLKLILYFIVLL